MPGLGTLPLEWLDPAMLTNALRRVGTSRQLAELALQYGEPAGDQRLRRALSHLLAERGVGAEPGQIITTIGATHGLDVVTRSLLRAGDTVLVDEPGWSVEYARLAALGLRVLPVPRRDDGPDLAVMEQLIDAQAPAERPRLYVTVSVLHNPTGASLSLQVAHRLLQLAQRHDFMVLEDDSYAHLAPPTCRGWPRSTRWSARSTSAASRRSWRRTGASASSPHRRPWSSASPTPSC